MNCSLNVRWPKNNYLLHGAEDSKKQLMNAFISYLKQAVDFPGSKFPFMGWEQRIDSYFKWVVFTGSTLVVTKFSCWLWPDLWTGEASNVPKWGILRAKWVRIKSCKRTVLCEPWECLMRWSGPYEECSGADDLELKLKQLIMIREASSFIHAKVISELVRVPGLLTTSKTFVKIWGPLRRASVPGFNRAGWGTV